MAADHRKDWILKEGDRIRCPGGDYIIAGSPIGYGGSAVIYPARRPDTHLNYVIKECFPGKGEYHRVGGVIVPRTPDSAPLLYLLTEGIRREQRIGQLIHNNGDRALCIRELLRPESVVTGAKTFRQVSGGCFSVLDQLDRNTVSFDVLLEQIAAACSPEDRRRTQGLPDIHTTACLMEEILTALQQVHTARDPDRPEVSGYYFGDLHGGNIFFSGSRIREGVVGHARLIDFGSARELDSDGRTGELEDGAVFAALGIRPPEMIRGGRFRLKRSADLFSAGCLMLRCVMTPIQLASYPELLCVGDEALFPEDCHRIGCDQEHLALLNRILDRATAFEEPRRYQTAEEMLVEIRELKRQTAPLKNRLGLKLSTLTEGAFVGRQRDLRTLDRLLRDRRNPIILHGFPGIGKTELAIEYGRRRSQLGRVYFVRFSDSFLQTITGPIADAFSGYRKTLPNGRPKPRDRVCREVLQLLGQCGENDILIIDHADCPSGVFAELRTEEYRRLCALPMHLILTTRCEPDGEGSWHEVGTLDEADLLKLLGRYVTFPPERLKPLIDAVGSHTLTVDLMGRTLGEKLHPVTPEALLEALTSGSAELLPQIGTSHDRSSSRDRLQGHLRTLFDLSGMQDDELRVLRCAALLPQEGMDADLFSRALTGEPAALERLTRTGWLTVTDGPRLQIHPVVRDLCRAELAPGAACGPFLDRLWDLAGESPADSCAQLAGCFAGAMALPELREPNRASRTGMLFRRAGLYGQSREYAQQALELAREQLPAGSAVLAQFYTNLGAAWGDLRETERERDCYRQAVTIQKHAGSAAALDLARTYSNLGSCCAGLGEHPQELDYQRRALRIRRFRLPLHHPDLIDSYSRVGGALCHGGDIRTGLALQEKALKLRRDILPPEHPDLASSHINTAAACQRLGRCAEALDHLLEALRIREHTLPPEHPDLAQVHRNLGIVYHQLGNWNSARDHYVRCLQIRRKVLSADDRLLIDAFTDAAEICGLLGDHDNELEYYLQLLELQMHTRAEDHPSLVPTYRAAARVCARLRDPEQQIYYLQKAALAGDRSSMRRAGELCIMHRHHDEGIHWLRQADRMGDPAAACDLGLLCLGSPALPRDLRQARRLLERAAAQGHPEANRRLGLILLGRDPRTRGEIPADPRKALDHLLRARELGAADLEEAIDEAMRLLGRAEKIEI